MSSNITKYHVAARCVVLLQRLLRDTQQPLMRHRVQEHIDRLTARGMLDSYQMILYRNLIILINDNYTERPNYELWSDGRLRIARYDSCLRMHDNEALRLAADGTADSGRANHGAMEGECICNTVEYENGKPKKYCYETPKTEDEQAGGPTVNNRPGRNFLQRVMKDETLSRSDFFLSLLVITFTAAISMAVLNSLHLSFLIVLAGIAIFALMLWIYSKRVADCGATHGSRIMLALLAILMNWMGLAFLLFYPTKVQTAAQAQRNNRTATDMREKAQKALANRCNSYDGDLPWLPITGEVQRMANDMMTGVANGTLAGGPIMPDGRDTGNMAEEQQRIQEERERHCKEREEAERKRREQEERDRTRRRIEREIDQLQSEKSSCKTSRNSAEREADTARQQGDTYASYARSEEDASRRNDYDYNAEREYAAEARARSEAARYQSRIDELDRRISDLRSQL